jgi:hypothetical protein
MVFDVPNPAPSPKFTAVLSRSRTRVWPFFLVVLAAAAALVVAIAA